MRSYGGGSSDVSVPQFIDEHAAEIRRRYLVWVDEFGSSERAGRSVADRMEVDRSGFSLWWMTSVFEKSCWDSPMVGRIVRIIALDMLLSEMRPGQVEVHADSVEGGRAIRRLCRNRCITVCQVKSVRRRQRIGPLRRLVPAPVLAVAIAVRLIAQYGRNRHRDLRSWTSGPRSVFLLSFFGPPDRIADDRTFNSRFWPGIENLLREAALAPNWVYLTAPAPSRPEQQSPGRILDEVRSQPEMSGHHELLGSYLTTAVLLRWFRRWLRQMLVSVGLRSVPRSGVADPVHRALWPLVSRRWTDDLRGPRSVSNLLWFGLFEAMCADLPRQENGYYLCEGTSWEWAFVHAWQSSGHGDLVAVPHTTIHFWDLRYLNYSPARCSLVEIRRLEPDRLVRNNVTAAEAMLVMGIGDDRVIDAESLRYMYLLEGKSDRGAGTLREMGDSIRRVFVLGELRPVVTTRLLHVLGEVSQSLSWRVDLALKPHPISPIDLGTLGHLDIRVVEGSIVGLAGGADLVVASHGTGAALDAYFSGLPVIIWLDGDDLNQSDLVGRSNVATAWDRESLERALLWAEDFSAASSSATEFFCLESGLPRWRRMLQGVGDGSAEKIDERG